VCYVYVPAIRVKADKVCVISARRSSLSPAASDCSLRPIQSSFFNQRWFPLICKRRAVIGCRAYHNAVHRRRLHGSDRPHGQKVVGAMFPSRPHGILLSVFWNSKTSQFIAIVQSQNKRTVKITNVSLRKWQKVRWFQPENEPKNKIMVNGFRY